MGRHIGLVGPKHSGKTTASRFLVEHLGFQRIALADPLKNVAVDMINTFNRNQGVPPIDRAYLDAHKDEVFVPFLQWLGTEYGRAFLNTPNRWINQFLAATYASPSPVVCDDVRFPNEADTLRDNSFLIVKIFRLPSARRTSLERAGVDVESILTHPSETETNNIEPDVTIYPSEDITSLQAHILWCVEFQRLCNELTELTAYVGPYVKPGYNADFTAKVRNMLYTKTALAVDNGGVEIINPDYQRRYNALEKHSDWVVA